MPVSVSIRLVDLLAILAEEGGPVADELARRLRRPHPAVGARAALDHPRVDCHEGRPVSASA